LARDKIQQARPLTEDPALVAAFSRMVLALVAQLRVLIATLHQWQAEISQLFAQHPDAFIFASFPAAGPVLAPRLQTAFGSRRDRFGAAQDLLQFSGVAPVTQRSGKSLQVHRRWARPKFLHQSLVEYAALSLPHCGWARALYHQLRARGQRHWAAIRVIAYKWVRIQFRCWKDRVLMVNPSISNPCSGATLNCGRPASNRLRRGRKSRRPEGNRL
jgi:hypothetical protein